MRDIEVRSTTRRVLAVVCAVLAFGWSSCERGGGDDRAPGGEAESAGQADDDDSRAGAAADDEPTGDEGGDEAADKEAPAGDPMPEMTARRLKGESVTIAPESEATLVNMWATWCAPCIAEFPEFRALRQEWGDRGLRLVGLSIQGREAEDRIREFIGNHEMPFDQVLFAPGGDPLKVFGGGSVPASFLYDADGQLVWWHGSMVKAPQIGEMESRLEELLGSGPD